MARAVDGGAETRVRVAVLGRVSPEKLRIGRVAVVSSERIADEVLSVYKLVEKGIRDLGLAERGWKMEEDEKKERDGEEREIDIAV